MTGGAAPRVAGPWEQVLSVGDPAPSEGQRVTIEDVWLDKPIPPPHPQEARQVENAVPKRQVEFAAGRYLARRALRSLGIADFVLLAGTDRAPLWPPGVLGTITHTGSAVEGDGYCAVAVATTAQCRGLGIDAEQAAPLDPDLWKFVLTQHERTGLADMPEAERGLWAKVMFSAKESVYKAQYPLTRARLGFQDVEITLHPTGLSFEARFTGIPPAPLPNDAMLVGGIHRAGRLILTGVILRG